MNKRSLTREATGILVSILFLALGFVAVWLTQSMLVAAGDAVFVSLLLLPIIVYVIFTGRLSELKAPGGLEVKLTEVAEQPAEDLASEKVLGEDMVVVPKSGTEELKRLESLLGNPKPIALTLQLGSNKYGKKDAEEYLERFVRYRNFTFVVFLDKKDMVVAYISSWAMFRIIQGDLGNKFIKLINDGNVLELVDFPGVMTQTVSTDDSNIEALNRMMASNLDAIPVIDESRKLKGVVERGQILGKLMLAMAK